MPHRVVIDWTMEVVMADHLVPERFKGMRCVASVAAMQPLPIDEVNAASAAFAALIRRHLFELLEAVEIVLAVCRRALDVEGLRLLELGHFEPQ
jgi:hypothetical protein